MVGPPLPLPRTTPLEPSKKISCVGPPAVSPMTGWTGAQLTPLLRVT